MKSSYLILAVLTFVTVFTSCKKDLCVSVIDQQGTICCQRCFDSQEELDLFNTTYTTTDCQTKCQD